MEIAPAFEETSEIASPPAFEETSEITDSQGKFPGLAYQPGVTDGVKPSGLWDSFKEVLSGSVGRLTAFATDLVTPPTAEEQRENVERQNKLFGGILAEKPLAEITEGGPLDTLAKGMREEASVSRAASELVYEKSDPRSQNVAAQVGRGTGMVASMLPSMLTGPAALPLMALQGAGEAYEGAYLAKENELKSQGITDPTTLRQEATKEGDKAALHTAPALLLYMAGGKVASGLGGKLAGEAASPIKKALFGAATATAANVTVGTVLRAFGSQGKVSNIIPTIENLTADTLFGIFHGYGEFNRASQKVRQEAREELERRGFSEEQVQQNQGTDQPQMVVTEERPSAPASVDEALAQVAQSQPPSPTTRIPYLITGHETKAKAEETARMNEQSADTEVVQDPADGQWTVRYYDNPQKYALSINQAKSDVRRVPEQPIEDAGKMPAPESAERVPQSITEPRPTSEAKDRIISTAIQLPSGELVTGKEWNAPHATMLMEAIEKGLPETGYEPSLGFVISEGGKERFASREEALEIARKSGQVDETKLTTNTKGLQSEGLIQPKVITPDEAAMALETYREAGIAMAKRSGATDLNAEDIFQQVQSELLPKIVSGELKTDKLGGLVSKAIRERTLNAIRSEQARAARQEAQEAPEVTTRGPRAETISTEDIGEIGKALDRLPGNQGTMIRMTAEGLSDAEIASKLNTTPEAVRTNKHRARQVMKEFIRSQGIGERLGPGAANQAEFRRAQYIAATDMLGESKNRAEWQEKMETAYEDAFSPRELDQVYAIAQEARAQFKESGGRKPIPAIISEMIGLTEPGKGQTGIANKYADQERAKRGLPPAMKVARRSQPKVWDEAMRQMDQDPQYLGNLVDKLKRDPRESITDAETAMLLHEQISRENAYDRAVDQVNSAKTEAERELATSRMKEEEQKLTEIYDINKVVGTAQGRSLAARRMLSGRDYTLARMIAETQASKNGEALTKEERSKVEREYEGIKETNAKLQERIAELEEQQARTQAEETISEMAKEVPVDPKVKPLVDRILARLDNAADKARERLRARLQFVGSTPDPTILYDLSIIGASKIAHGLVNFSRWSASMLGEFGEGVKPYLRDAFEASNKRVDDAVEAIAPKNERVRTALKNPTNEQIIDDATSKIKDRLEEGESLNELRSYIQKLALAFVRGGTTKVDPLVDSVHAVIEPLVPGITKRQTMDLISGYGDSKALDMEAAKATLRDLKGQAQQLAKLEDIQARVPLERTGVERRIPSDVERRLIREVNEAKKKFGVVVNDPARQLKSALDSVKTTLKNQIRDLTHQIETGEKPIPGTPAPSDTQVEALKSTRDRLRNTLKDLEGKVEMTDEQRIKTAEQSLERSISELEQRIKNKDYLPSTRKAPESEKIAALRAQRDSLRSELDALKAADQDLRDTQTFDRLMREAAELQDRLTRGDVQPKTKAEKIEDDLVREARANVQQLRQQLREARARTPEYESAKLENAIKAVERSIASLDAKLKSGDVGPSGKPKGPSSPILERLRAERDAMRKLVTGLRKGPPPDPTQVAFKLLKARLERQTSQLQDRIARSDFAPKPRRVLDLSQDPEAVRLTAEYNQWRKAFELAKYENEQRNANILEKSYRKTADTLNAAKSSVGSLDLSAFARQSAVLSASHPIMALKNLGRSVMGMNEAKYERMQAELEVRPNARNGYYQMAKLQFTDAKGPLSSREEVFRSNLAEKLPWVRWSNRAFVTFLNRMRADAFDLMLAGSPVHPTPEQVRALGSAVNIFTGRGELGRFSGAADALAIPFWSPRLYVSRLQTILGQPIWNKNAAGVRKVIAKEYLRASSFGLGIIILGLAAGADIEHDPDSSDFAKLRFGNTRIDPWGGHQQWMVFASRFLSGDYKTTSGRETEFDKARTPLDPTMGDTTWRMIRSKFNPVLGSYFDWKEGRDLGGRPVGPVKAVAKTVMPLAVFNDDIVPIAKEHGMDAAGAALLLNMIGVGVQNYDPASKKARFNRN